MATGVGAVEETSSNLLIFSAKQFSPSENPAAIFSCMAQGNHFAHQAWPLSPL